ncbi:MAG: metallophosphoesterase family protein, partial [Defluviitaleaceae bacterium]|nr:metallophosphoesterase family protein [Defluviitaleaceae bacterium]
VKGNHERYLIEGIPSEIPNSENMGLAEMEHHKWEHSLLSIKSKDYIRNLKYEEWITVNNKKIYISHYAIDENNCYFNNGIRNHTVDELDDLFGYVDADIILYGHEHRKSILKGDKHYINCGSLGCPMKDKNIARAGILTIDKDIAFTELTIEYDVQRVLNDIEIFDYPAKDEIKRIFYGV